MTLTALTILDRAVERRHEEFGAVETTKTHGRRKVGASTVIHRVRFDPVAADRHSGYTVAPGEYFQLWVSATRDGNDYGATAAWRLFGTLDEARRAADKYFVAARKRAVKKFPA
jgi:hypothetical protein